MFTKRFWADLIERAVATFAQALLAASGGDMLVGVNLTVGTRLRIAAGAAGLSLLKGIAASGVGNKDSAAALPASVEDGHGSLELLVYVGVLVVLMLLVLRLT